MIRLSASQTGVASKAGGGRGRRQPGWRRTCIALAIGLIAFGVSTVPASAAGGPNLAAGKSASASSSNGPQVASLVNDGNQATYWESAGALPQSVQVNLGSAVSIDQVIVKLPAAWGTRTQTLAVEGSTNGSTWTPLSAPAGRTFTAGTNSVTISLPASSQSIVRVTISANTGWAAAQLAELEIYGAAGGPSNLAAGRSMSTNGHTQTYVAQNANDGNQATYWEGAANAYPRWLQVDLGTAVSVNQIVVKVPTAWGSRTQTFSVEGSTDGTNFGTLVASGGYVFNPAANTVTVNFTASTQRHIRLSFTANTGSTSGQVSEFEVYGTAIPTDTTAPGVPTNLTGSASGTTVTLGWSAATDNAGGSGMAGYNIVKNGAALKTVGNVTSTTDTCAAGTTSTYNVQARDVAGNLSANGNTVTVVCPSAPGDTTPPSIPANLTGTTSGTTVTLTWSAATDNAGGSGVSGYDLYRGGAFVKTVTGTSTTDTQAANAAVSYTVRARDGASNVSGDSNTFTRPCQSGCGGTPSNQAAGKTLTASSSVFSFVPANANDGDRATYWEGNGLPADLTVPMGSNVTVSSVVVQLNPASSWGPRNQTIAVLGREQSASTFVTARAAQSYAFSPTAGGNEISIPVTGSYADIRLAFSLNSGAGSGQVAEVLVMGVPAPNPDLTVTTVTATPATPDETSAITMGATVRNAGTATSGATNVKFFLGTTEVGTAAVGALTAGESVSVSANIGIRPMGTYVTSARVDDPSVVVEQSETNNTGTGPTVAVSQAPGPDLQVLSITSNPPNPAVGAAVSFVVAVKNRGTTAVAAGTTTRVVAGTTTLNATTPAIGAGVTVNVTVGSWTATSGGATVTATADATNTIAETSESNNSFSQSIVVGRGAAVPYRSYEAEAASFQGTLLIADAVRTFGHTNFATESSGRQSVRLTSTGQFVEFTSTSPANSIVVRNSVPDAPGGGGQDASISLYINGSFAQKLTLTSRNSWLYGTTDDTESLSNTPSADARRLFDESNALLAQSYPAGTRFKLQRDAGDSAAYYVIDTIDLEQVAAPLSKPAECTSITAYGAVAGDGIDDSAAIQRAVTDDQNGVIACVWIPAGQWRQEQKILSPDPARGQYNQRGIRNVVVRGAGMWHAQLYTNTEPQNVVGNINHPHEGNVGFDIDDNTQISDIAIFGMTTNRANRGHGLNGRLGMNTKIANVWIEHVNVGAWVGRDYSDTPAYWNPGDGLEFTGMRIRNTYADGINFSNGTRNSRVFNSSFRTNGDDALAVWANTRVKDQTIDVTHDNHFVNNTIQLPWRANGIAIYGGYSNSIENNLIFDTMNYPAIMLATDHSPLPFSGTTLIANNGIYRGGGVFWGEQQEFGAITLFPSTSDIVGVTIRDTDIVDSTYDGIQFKNGSGSMPNVVVTNVRIDKSNNGAGILAMGGARGNAVLTNVVITNSAKGNVVLQPGTQFVITGS